MFSLVDLMKDKIPGRYYSEQLKHAPKPTDDQVRK